MSPKSKKAILVVSFGTSFEATRKLTLEAIENDIACSYPEYSLYRAWTSKMILAKLKKRDNLYIHNVKEAMEQILSDGITDLIVQPTHVINGIENDIMKEEVLSFQDKFDSIRFGNPLLTTEKDHQAAILAVVEEFSYLSEDSALVFMGHGTNHYANSVYAALDYKFKDMGYPNIHLGTVEAYPSLQSIFRLLKQNPPQKVILAPFMIVAGDHAHHDMAGEDSDSWMALFQKEGYHTIPVLKGLGEYPGIRKLFISHVQDAINQK